MLINLNLYICICTIYVWLINNDVLVLNVLFCVVLFMILLFVFDKYVVFMNLVQIRFWQHQTDQKNRKNLMASMKMLLFEFEFLFVFAYLYKNYKLPVCPPPIALSAWQVCFSHLETHLEHYQLNLKPIFYRTAEAKSAEKYLLRSGWKTLTWKLLH